jgi:hypothetical protein
VLTHQALQLPHRRLFLTPLHPLLLLLLAAELPAATAAATVLRLHVLLQC